MLLNFLKRIKNKFKKCNIEVHYNKHNNRYNTFDSQRISGITYPTLILTCEEVIIKGLLE